MNPNTVPPVIDTADLETLLLSSPFNKMLGLKLGAVDVAAGTLEVHLPYTPDLQRMQGSDQIHGGAIGALIDVAATYAVVAKTRYAVPTIDLRIDYMRPARGGDLVAKATVRKVGQRVGIADVEVRDGTQRIIALGRGAFSTG